MDNTFAELYAPRPDIPFAVKYRATCHCAAVRYEVSADPVDAKMCHCDTCQTLHGAPMQWAAIFHKHHVRISQGQRPLLSLRFESAPRVCLWSLPVPVVPQ